MTPLPTQYQNRWVYMVVAFISAVLPLGFLTVLMFPFGPPDYFILFPIIYLILSPLFAYGLWIDKYRTSSAMVLRGMGVVAVSIILGSMIVGIIMMIFDTELSSIDRFEYYLTPFKMAFFGVTIGSIGTLGTLGTPWLLGIGVSLLFREQ